MNPIESDRLLSKGSCYDNGGDGQNSVSNAWNVNFNNANVNNNNRTNSNWVRPFAESLFDSLDAAVVPFESFIEAYLHCRKNKRSSPSAVMFEMNWTGRLYKLWRSVVEDNYVIGKSICFVVRIPVPREVFAADFCDRIIHHWIALRIEPLMNGYLYNCMCSNRKGYGTSRAVEIAYNLINDGKGGVIYKFDIQGFFMSIDKRILCKRLTNFVAERYDKPDLNILLGLIRKVVMHCPQKNCLLRSPRKSWDLLPANKSLFHQDDFHGLAIGNLTSQIFANFYLYPIIDAIIRFGVNGVAQYVDDIFVKIDTEKRRKELQAVIESELARIGLTIHPKKRYIQPACHGVSFIGAKVCAGRMYPGGRFYDRMWLKLRHYKEFDAESFSGINSYLGLMRNGKMRTYRLRRDYSMRALEKFSGRIYIKNNQKAVLKQRYKPMVIMRQRINSKQY